MVLDKKMCVCLAFVRETILKIQRQLTIHVCVMGLICLKWIRFAFVYVWNNRFCSIYHLCESNTWLTHGYLKTVRNKMKSAEVKDWDVQQRDNIWMKSCQKKTPRGI